MQSERPLFHTAFLANSLLDLDVKPTMRASIGCTEYCASRERKLKLAVSLFRCCGNWTIVPMASSSGLI